MLSRTLAHPSPSSRPRVWLLTVLAALATTSVAACSGGSSPADEPPTEPTAIIPTATPASPASPLALTVPPGPGGLWTGVLSPESSFLWLAFRLTQGQRPDADPWQIRSVYPFEFDLSCSPRANDTGWLLTCSGLGSGSLFEATVPRDAGGRLEVNVAFSNGTRLQGALTKTPLRNEPLSSANVSLVWHYPTTSELGQLTDVWAQDGIVFAPHASEAIELLDAATGRQVSVIRVDAGTRTAPGGARWVNNIKVRDGILYAATTTRGLLIYDIKDAANPKFLGQHMVNAGANSRENFFNIHNIYLSPRGDIIYAMNQSIQGTDLRLIDVRNPSAPREAGRYSITSTDPYAGVHDINVVEREGRLIAYLNYLREGLRILDVTDPATIAPLGVYKPPATFSHSAWGFSQGGQHFVAHADEGYDTGLTVLNVTNPAQPVVVSTFKTRPGISIHNVEVVDSIAYISYYIDGLRVVDLRDPARPAEIGHYDTAPADQERDVLQGAWGVHVADGLVFISDMEGGVFAFRVALP